MQQKVEKFLYTYAFIYPIRKVVCKHMPLALVLKYGIGDFIGIMEEKEKLEHDLSEVLVMANKIIVDANVKIGKLSERLGRIMIKHGKIDHTKTGFFSWSHEYMNVKEAVIGGYNNIIGAYKSAMDFYSTENVYLNSIITTEFARSIADFSNLRIKIGVLDDVLTGLLEDIWDNVQFEDAQKEQLEKVMKDNIEKTKELPTVMYG